MGLVRLTNMGINAKYDNKINFSSFGDTIKSFNNLRFLLPIIIFYIIYYYE